jgi:hypothetical protein
MTPMKVSNTKKKKKKDKERVKGVKYTVSG